MANDIEKLKSKYFLTNPKASAYSIPVDEIVKETPNAILFGFKDNSGKLFSFWCPKKLVNYYNANRPAFPFEGCPKSVVNIAHMIYNDDKNQKNYFEPLAEYLGLKDGIGSMKQDSKMNDYRVKVLSETLDKIKELIFDSKLFGDIDSLVFEDESKPNGNMVLSINNKTILVKGKSLIFDLSFFIDKIWVGVPSDYHKNNDYYVVEFYKIMNALGFNTKDLQKRLLSGLEYYYATFDKYYQHGDHNAYKAGTEHLSRMREIEKTLEENGFSSKVKELRKKYADKLVTS